MRINEYSVLKKIQQNVGTKNYARFRDRFIGDTRFACEVLGFSTSSYLRDYECFIDDQQGRIQKMQRSNGHDIQTMIGRKSAHIRFIKQSIFKAFADLGYI